MINKLEANINRCFAHAEPKDLSEELLSIISLLSQLNQQSQSSNHAKLLKFDNCTAEITFSECYEQFIIGTVEDFTAQALIKTFAIYPMVHTHKLKSWDITDAYYEQLLGQTITQHEFIFHTIRKASDIKYAAFPEDHLYEICARLMYYCKYMRIDGERFIDLRLKYIRVK